MFFSGTLETTKGIQNDSSPENKTMIEKMKELTKTASEYCDERKIITNR